tara:strand:+ start:2525 stop:2758 length:234 start_codon:yes stop_codon:yes gene_type:complete
MFKWLKTFVFGPDPVEEKPASGVRARGPKGRFKADDKSTPDINEAYVDGKTPKRKKAAPKAAPKKRGRPKGSKNKVK